jgi:hypothetical protein
MYVKSGDAFLATQGAGIFQASIGSNLIKIGVFVVKRSGIRPNFSNVGRRYRVPCHHLHLRPRPHREHALGHVSEAPQL